MTYPVGDEGAAGLPHGDLCDRADAVRSYGEAVRQPILTHASTQSFQDPFAVLAPLTRRLDLDLLPRVCFL